MRLNKFVDLTGASCHSFFGEVIQDDAEWGPIKVILSEWDACNDLPYN